MCEKSSIFKISSDDERLRTEESFVPKINENKKFEPKSNNAVAHECHAPKYYCRTTHHLVGVCQSSIFKMNLFCKQKTLFFFSGDGFSVAHERSSRILLFFSVFLDFFFSFIISMRQNEVLQIHGPLNANISLYCV